MLSAVELTQRRDQVLGVIGTLPVADALIVMSAVMGELAQEERPITGDGSEAANDCETPSLELVTRWRRLSKVEADPEVRNFIHGLRGRRSIEQIAEDCRERFGKRAPSRSAIQRYCLRLKYRRGTGGKAHE